MTHKNHGMFYVFLFISSGLGFFASSSVSVRLALLRHPFLVIISGVFSCIICCLSSANCLWAQELQVVGRRGIELISNRQTLWKELPKQKVLKSESVNCHYTPSCRFQLRWTRPKVEGTLFSPGDFSIDPNTHSVATAVPLSAISKYGSAAKHPHVSYWLHFVFLAC